MYHFGIRFLICNILICLYIGIIICLKKLLKKYLSARLQYNLWLVLLIILVIPFLPVRSSPARTLFTWFPILNGTQTTDVTAGTYGLTYSGQESTIDKMSDFAVSISSQTPSHINILLLVFWGIGICAMILLAFRSWNRLKTIEKSALPLQNQKVKAIFRECISEAKIKKTIPVYSTAFLKSPITVGFFRPRIYIPIHLISDFNPKDMRFTILHELQHYRYKDTLIGYMMNLAGILYWFNPLIWYALRQMRCDREIACDSAVLQILHEADYEAYGNTLINFAEKISLSPFPFTTGISGSMRQMKKGF